MGNCCNKQESFGFPTDFEYHNIVSLELQSVYGSQINLLPADNTFTLPSPTIQDNINIFLSNLPFKVSGCVLPGMDFRSGQNKICQDNFFFIVHNNCLLSVLCDGHGTEGHHISKYALDYIQKSFKKKFSAFKHDPKSSVFSILQKCDEKILSQLECTLSGTTIIINFIADGVAFTASLGDSRAVLGYLDPVAETCKQRQGKYFRQITCERSFKVFPLTVDQKPEDEKEEFRIKKSGGLVHKYMDAFGRSVGPYRVWQSNGSGPGLAMSRSLGDKVGKGCGVISVPLHTEKRLVSGKDQYIVLASDGVWDVMENVEVVNFVEKWKGMCLNQENEDYPANPNNSSISRLLCEEARYRWLGIAQSERVCIDDISCVVIDFAIDNATESVLETENDKKLVSLTLSADTEEQEIE